MENPKISVLISMYNGEQLLPRMIDCVLAQTFQDFELILIDDGSPDRCGEIAEEYAAKDQRVHVLHKPNGGLSDARNHGLVIAKGEYTIQFDQDDYVDNTCLEELYAKAIAEDADMVICDCYYEDQYQQKYGKQEPSALDHSTVLKDMLTGRLFGYMWNKMIRRSCYSQYNIQFPIEIYGCEDQYAMCDLLKNDIKIVHLPRAFYHYLYYPGSLSRHYDDKTYQNDLKIREMFTSLCEDTPYKQLAYDSKTQYLVGRAFMFGQKMYSSKRFAEEYGQYKDIVMSHTSSKMFRLFYNLSFNGHYQLARKLFTIGFEVKQMLKKIRSKK